MIENNHIRTNKTNIVNLNFVWYDLKNYKALFSTY